MIHFLSLRKIDQIVRLERRAEMIDALGNFDLLTESLLDEEMLMEVRFEPETLICLSLGHWLVKYERLIRVR